MTLLSIRSFGPARTYVKAALLALALAVSLAPAGCQKGDADSADEAAGLLGEMKAWFEATDYETYGYASLQEALDDIYQDEGYTSGLYADISEALEASGPATEQARAVLGECQAWFELIDYEMSGYASLEEAIEDIYQDEGATLDLYRRLATYNAGSE
jgi:hypothetical protein